MRRARSVLAAVLTASALTGGLLAGPVLATEATASTTATTSISVGRVTMHPCDVGIDSTWCGSITAAWDPDRPALGRITVGFAYRPASGAPGTRPQGTVVPHEGGPGYATTDSSGWFAQMYGPLLQTHALLLVDQRGTGRSQPIVCRPLDEYSMSFVRAVGACGRLLGERADLYASRYSADDLANVLDALGLARIDLYGDSYGTFFAQVFAARHPERLRTLILDGAYPTFGEGAW